MCSSFPILHHIKERHFRRRPATEANYRLHISWVLEISIWMSQSLQALNGAKILFNCLWLPLFSRLSQKELMQITLKKDISKGDHPTKQTIGFISAGFQNFQPVRGRFFPKAIFLLLLNKRGSFHRRPAIEANYKLHNIWISKGLVQPKTSQIRLT